MALSEAIKRHITETIKVCLRKKFSDYNRETDSMPFHYRLLGRDRMELYSFMHSLVSTFGTSIYEPIAKELATPRFKFVETQFVLPQQITEAAQSTIQKIMNDLSENGEVNKKKEIELLKKVSTKGKANTFRTIRVDLFLISKEEEVFMFDLKTVKPNSGDFVKFKRVLLEWTALYLYENPKAKVNTIIAIPYNPYEPKPYSRWTMKGMLDLDFEVKVSDEFWDFIGGKGTYSDLLDCFEKAGIELRPEIDKYFSKFK